MTKTSEDLPQITKRSKLTEKQQRFIDNLHNYRSLKLAAKAAGYSKKTSHNITQHIKSCPGLMSALRTFYQDNATLLLHDMTLIDKNVMEFCKDKNNVEKVPKFTHSLKQIKQVAGVLAEDTTPRQPTVNIANIEKVQVAIGDMLTKRLQGTGNTNDTP
jgi:phage terminase small subunit